MAKTETYNKVPDNAKSLRGLINQIKYRADIDPDEHFVYFAEDGTWTLQVSKSHPVAVKVSDILDEEDGLPDEEKPATTEDVVDLKKQLADLTAAFALFTAGAKSAAPTQPVVSK